LRCHWSIFGVLNKIAFLERENRKEIENPEFLKLRYAVAKRFKTGSHLRNIS
jgi:hypothetical protein